MNLGKMLKSYRWVNQISLREMAKILRTSAGTLSRFENGKNMDGKTLAKILK